MAVTKKEVKKVADAAKATAVELKADAVKAAETKVEAAKEKATEAKKTAEVKVEAVKEKAAETKKTVTKKATAAKKTVAKKAAAATTAAKKAVAKAAALPAQQVYVEFAGSQSDIDAIVTRVRDNYIESGHKASSIKNVKVYLKPEENKAYYVINDKNAGAVDLF